MIPEPTFVSRLAPGVCGLYGLPATPEKEKVIVLTNINLTNTNLISISKAPK